MNNPKTDRSSGCAAVPGLKWRRGYESNIPRPGKRTDNGFEDRGGHQAPITLRPKSPSRGLCDPRANLSPLCPHCFDDGIGIGELSRLQLRVDVLSIDGDLETPAARRHERQRTNVLFQLEQLVRQTDGMRLVVSNAAVFDGDFQTHGDDGNTIESGSGIVKLGVAAVATDAPEGGVSQRPVATE